MNSPSRRRRAAVLTILLAVLLLVASVLSLGVGVAHQTPGEVVRALSDGARGVVTGQPVPADEAHTVVLSLRLPRLLLAILVGVCLALSGAIMQALFQNSLADPYILGVSSGAALGAVVAMILGGLMAAGALTASVPLLAFGGALVVVFAVYALAQRGGRVQTGTLLLTGIAVGSLISAVTSFLMMVMDEDLRTVLFWLLGGLSGRSWPAVATIVPAAAVGLIGAQVAVRPLNLLLLGDETAASLGLNLQLAKRLLLALASLL
ncbi:MAG: iron ABC transporter permease, partial [Armatimonadetes bacterium]|nr:iron ABC transporter permease [Armatimonadota bacterium]